MEMISLKCPSCGGAVDIEEGHDSCLCPYCGTRLYLDDGTIRINIRDEAKLKEAEANEAIRLKELELEQQKLKTKHRVMLVAFLVALVIAVLGLIMFLTNRDHDNVVPACIMAVSGFIMMVLGAAALSEHLNTNLKQ